MKNLYRLALMLFFLTFGLPSFAQQASRGPIFSYEERSEREARRMAIELQLSTEQEKKLFSLILKRSINMVEARESRDDEGLIKAGEEYDKGLLTVLSINQMKKYEELEAQRRRDPPH